MYPYEERYTPHRLFGFSYGHGKMVTASVEFRTQKFLGTVLGTKSRFRDKKTPTRVSFFYGVRTEAAAQRGVPRRRGPLNRIATSCVLYGRRLWDSECYPPPLLTFVQ